MLDVCGRKFPQPHERICADAGVLAHRAQVGRETRSGCSHGRPSSRHRLPRGHTKQAAQRPAGPAPKQVTGARCGRIARTPQRRRVSLRGPLRRDIWLLCRTDQRPLPESCLTTCAELIGFRRLSKTRQNESMESKSSEEALAGRACGFGSRTSSAALTSKTLIVSDFSDS